VDGQGRRRAQAKAVASLAAKTDKLDARVLAELARRDLVPEVWVPSLGGRELKERLGRRMHLVRLRTSSINRAHGVLTQFGIPSAFDRLLQPDAGELLERRGVPEVWRRSVAEAVAVVDHLDALLAVGLVAILLPLIQGREHGWPAWTWISLAAAPVILAAFVALQRRLARRGQPALLDLRPFAERTFSAGLGTMLALSSVQAAFFVYLAFYLQQGRGLNPLEAGLVFTILAVAYVVASGPAPKLTAERGRTIVAAGGLTLLLGLVVLAVAVAEVGVGGPLLALVPGLVLVAAGIGLTFTPIQQTVLSNVDPAHAGAASGMLSTIQQVGFALGVAISGVVYFGAAEHRIAEAFQTTLWQMRSSPSRSSR
jgi:Major Facilitator Superfamily/Transposase